jgi:glycosyltransferase involved in cell wall biosynthesis
MFLAQITHEAVLKVGGIGAVLAGLLTSRHYKSTVKRTVFVGALSEEDRKILEAGRSDLNMIPAGKMEDRTAAVGLAQIEKRHGVKFYYCIRRYPGGESGVDNEAEVLLVDVSQMPKEQVKAVRQRLQDEFSLQFDHFRLTEIQDRFVRLAVPAYEALLTLRRSKDGPCNLISHDWYGLPTALWAISRRDPRFRTVYYAHEVAPARTIIEKHPAREFMFYNVMRAAQAAGKSLVDVFGPQEGSFATAITMRAHRLDRILAVSDSVAAELRFLGSDFAKAKIDLVYDGIAASRISLEAHNEAHHNLEEYAKKLVGWKPNFVFSHVGRPVPSKAFWRDLEVMEALDSKLAAAEEKAVLFIVASAAPTRTTEEVARMEKAYNWPVSHKKGAPDLVGTETAIEEYVERFNKKAKASQAVFVNQFGWDRNHCGSHMPKAMTATDIRRGIDLEFGLSTYEPFGIAALEPLPFGAICVLSAACGCRPFIEKVDKKKELACVLFKDYAPSQTTATIAKLQQLTGKQASDVEKKIAAELADEIFKLLPRSDKDRKRLLTLGYRYARQMSWEVVARDYFLNAIRPAAT